MSDIIQPAPEPPIVRQTTGGRKMLAVLLALVIFVCGGATGFGVSMLHHRPPPPMGFMPDPPVEDLVSRLRDELLLSDDQVKKVHDIYQQRREALRTIRDAMEPKMKAEYDKLDEQMKAVLNTAQYQRLERTVSKRERSNASAPAGRQARTGWTRRTGWPDGTGWTPRAWRPARNGRTDGAGRTRPG